MARIAVGGWHHETNTFAPTKATYEDFARAGGWPGLSRGAALGEAMAGLNVPISGFIDAANEAGHELVPLLWCNASPSAHVTTDAYERIAGMLLADLAAALPVDAVYLDLHGAMVSEHLEDGEGELLRRLRALVGDELPVVASLDFHANITAEMVALSDGLVGFRTYPHTDMAETGRRAAAHLDRLVQGRDRRHKAMRKLPYLLPLTWQCTLVEPARSIYAGLGSLERGGVDSVSLALGFPLADIAQAGPAVVAYGADESATAAAADTVAGLMVAREGDFAGRFWSPDEAVAYCLANARRATRPFVLADTQDNPGAGGDGDTTGLLAALVRQQAERAVVAMLYDPATALVAHQAGAGAEITIGLGERAGLPGHTPYSANFRVERIGDGRVMATGPFYGGSRMQLGPMALLSLGGVRVVVASRKQQCADQAMLRCLGVEPGAERILALKSSVHFRADFEPIAEEVLVVLAPGPCVEDTLALAYKHLRPGVRLQPNGRFSG